MVFPTRRAWTLCTSVKRAYPAPLHQASRCLSDARMLFLEGGWGQSFRTSGRCVWMQSCCIRSWVSPNTDERRPCGTSCQVLEIRSWKRRWQHMPLSCARTRLPALDVVRAPRLEMQTISLFSNLSPILHHRAPRQAVSGALCVALGADSLRASCAARRPCSLAARAIWRIRPPHACRIGCGGASR